MESDYYLAIIAFIILMVGLFYKGKEGYRM